MATQKSFTKKQIDDAIDSQMADNTSQAITASNVRSITKDYMTGSMAAPMLIYAGQITSGATAANCVVRDQYYNPDFFQKQNNSNLTSTDNIISVDSTTMAGLADGTYTTPLGGGPVGLITFTVASNLITSIEITEPLVGSQIGDSFTLKAGYSNVITYNGVIRPQDPTGSITETYFKLTENSDNTYSKHSNINTIVSTANRNLSMGASSTLEFVYNEKNEILFGYADSLAIFNSKTTLINGSTNPPQTTTTYRTQHIQLYRLPGTEESRSVFSN